MSIVDSLIALAVTWFTIADKKCMVCWKGYATDSLCMPSSPSDSEIISSVGIEAHGIEQILSKQAIRTNLREKITNISKMVIESADGEKEARNH